MISNSAILSPYPVALFAYSRLSETIECLESLQKCKEFKDTKLYVFLDFYKNESVSLENQKLFRFLSSYDHDNYELVYRTENFGLARNIIEGVSYVLDKEAAIIVLEDDIIVSKTFLSYMNEALDFYKDNDKVSSIHAYNYPFCSTKHSFFQAGADCWGWSTWPDRWDREIFSKPNITILKKKIIHRKHIFNYLYSFPYSKMLMNEGSELFPKSWAIIWHAHNFLGNKVCLYPPKSLISNIGLDGNGENCSETIYNVNANELLFDPPNSNKHSWFMFIRFSTFFTLRRVKYISNRLLRLFK